LWFGGESQNFDPRAPDRRSERNSMKASEYGIKKLKRILIELPLWTKEEADRYDNLETCISNWLGNLGGIMIMLQKISAGFMKRSKALSSRVMFITTLK